MILKLLNMLTVKRENVVVVSYLTLPEADREAGLETNTEKTKHMLMYRHQNAWKTAIYWLLKNPLKI